jgi:ribose transport system permease protein
MASSLHSAGKLPVHRLIASAPMVIFAAMLLYISTQAPNFLSFLTASLILKQALPVVIICAGLAVVVMAGGNDVVSGGIDLSIPATAVLCAGIVAQWLSQDGSLLVALILAFCAALSVGLVNAILVTFIGLTPLLTTLSMFVAVVGINNVVTASRRINVDDAFILWFRDETVFGVPVGIPLVALLVLVLWHLAHRTRFGLNLQAVGGNRDAAEVSGLNVVWLQSASFGIAAIAGFCASLFVLARGSGYSPGVEDNLMLEMVLATFLGAAFSRRRVVTVWGAVLGALLVAAITIGFKSMGVNVFWIGLIKGSLILAVVAFGALANRGRA